MLASKFRVSGEMGGATRFLQRKNISLCELLLVKSYQRAETIINLWVRSFNIAEILMWE